MSKRLYEDGVPFFSPNGIIYVEASKISDAISTNNWDEVYDEILNAGSITAKDNNKTEEVYK